MALMCLGVVHILPNAVICMGRHALVVLGSPQRQDDGAHALKIVDTECKCTLKSARGRSYMAGIYQRLNGCQLVMRNTRSMVITK